MKLVRTPQGEVIEVSVVGENTELTQADVAVLYAQEAANVELLVRQINEYDNLIAEQEQKKLVYPEEEEIFDAEIVRLNSLKQSARDQKTGALAKVVLYGGYI